MMRLDKYLADCGIGTRTEVKKIIKSKKIMINGQVVSKPEVKVDESKDKVSINGKSISYEKYGYYLFHKPAGCVTAVKDNLHKTVMDYFPEKEFTGFAPVGRLDLDTEGFLLVTNDGPLAHHLISPSHHVSKTYYVETDGALDESFVQVFADGLDIGDETLTLPAELEILPVKVNESGSAIYSANITVYEGRFHQVKRMFQAVDRKVIYLKRMSMGNLSLDGLEKGTYHKLTSEEVKLLSTNNEQHASRAPLMLEKEK